MADTCSAEPFRMRAELTKYAMGLLGVPYIWAGRDPVAGMDCSGFAYLCFRQLGLLPPGAKDDRHFRGWWNAQKFADTLEPVAVPEPGDLAFYGRSWDRVTHVMVVLAGGYCIGASGGDSTCTTAEAARKKDAKVKLHHRLAYRPDFLGCRRLPLPK